MNVRAALETVQKNLAAFTDEVCGRRSGYSHQPSEDVLTHDEVDQLDAVFAPLHAIAEKPYTPKPTEGASTSEPPVTK